MNIKDAQDMVHGLALSKGWWDDSSLLDLDEDADKFTPQQALEISSRLCLIHSEVSEALECVRDNEADLVYLTRGGKPEGLAVELVDVIIRSLDLLGALGVDAEQVLVQKHKYNRTRARRHGGKAL